MPNPSELCTTLRMAVMDKYAHTTATDVHAVGEAAEAHLKTRPKTPSYSFPKGERDALRPSPTPSPSAYYNPDKHTTLSRTFHSHIGSPALTKFGSSTRDQRHMSDSPGPAQYEPGNLNAVRARTPSWGVGTSQRDGRNSHAELPGPGAYSVPSGIGKQALSLRATSASMRFGSSSRSDLRVSAVPGPGTYDVTVIDGVGGRAATSTRPRSATTRFGTGARQWEKGPGGPGPAYSPDIGSTVPKSPTWSFAHGPRDSVAKGSGAPGPGAYDSTTNALGMKPATLTSPPGSPFPKGDRFSSPKVTGPGPGAYGTPADVRESAPRVKFGSSHRDDSKPNPAPGPGAYAPTSDTVRPRSASTRFGSSGRFGTYTPDTPGPDAYGLPDTSGVKPQAGRYKFGQSSRDAGESPHRATPGPDAYSVDGAHAAVHHRDPRFSFSHGGRFEQRGADGPGPGEYGLPKLPTPGSPAFTMRAR